MENVNVLDNFVDRKKAESNFVSLTDGESVVIARLKDIKCVVKAGFAGEEKEVLRLVCDVETSEGIREKTFDNGTQRFAQELQEKGVKIGSSFAITRTGIQTKTRYTVSNVVNPQVQATAFAGQAQVTAPSPVMSTGNMPDSFVTTATPTPGVPTTPVISA